MLESKPYNNNVLQPHFKRLKITSAFTKIIIIIIILVDGNQISELFQIVSSTVCSFSKNKAIF